VLHQSFEAFNLSNKAGEFDHVIGNVPFGERSAALSSLDIPDEKSLDNYFVSRSIDNLKEGGSMALIAASGVLENKSNEEFRVSINKKVQFIGAVKLPNRSFYHSHTQVTPDVLLFRKYPKDIQERLSVVDDETFKNTLLYDNVFVSGTYFEMNPQNIAGVLSKGTGQWGNDEIKGDITPESFEQILSTFQPASLISEDIFRQTRDNFELPDISKITDKLALSDNELQQLKKKTLRHGALKITDNRVYILSESHSWLFISDNSRLAGKLLDIQGVSSAVRAVRDKMNAEDGIQSIRLHQKQCKTLLLDYWRKYNNLPIDDPDLKKFTRENPAVQGVYETFLKTDDPLLIQENVYRKQVDILDGHNTAIQSLLILRQKMKEATEENIRLLFPDNAKALINEMQRHEDVFINPEGCFQLREDFIAGEAWQKIDTLKAASENENIAWKKEKLLYGAGELEKAVGWANIEEADFSPRSSWIPQDIVREWASSKEALGNNNLKYLAKNNEGKWEITSNGKWQEYPDPIVYYLNGQKQRSRFYDTESYNKEHDELFRSFIANH
jgi:hypothetical protein